MKYKVKLTENVYQKLKNMNSEKALMIAKDIYREFEYVTDIDKIYIYKKNIGRYRITFKLVNEIVEDIFKTPEKEIVILTLNKTDVGK